jgi:uncharacterized protein YdhG (YjbR/CyaY superfamily)
MRSTKDKARRAELTDAEKTEAYISEAPEPARQMMTEIRAIVRASAPKDTVEVFSYGMPGFRYKGSLLWYGYFKVHVGFFPGSPPMIKALAEELKDYKSSKGGIQFPFGRPVPKALVKKIVKLRVKENEGRQRD